MSKTSGGEGTARIPAPWLTLFVTWVIATVAVLASLFFSEVMEVPVCSLCWYQRIALYPLAIILALGLFPFDVRVTRYGLALAGVGWLVALYHVLLVTGIVPERMQPCVQDVPCSEIHVALFGFFSIPTLSLLTFTLIGALLLLVPRIQPK